MVTRTFEGKTAIITGAGQGIGFAIARELGLQGAIIILNDLDEIIATKAANKLAEEGINVKLVIGDSGDLNCITKLLETAVSAFGGLDMAIANAGITTFGSFLDYPESSFDKLVEVNLKGTYFLAQKAALQMIKQGNGGRILLMSSVTGHQYHPDLTAYGMSKAAIRFLAKSLGVELAPHQITVNAISPGATITERTLELDTDYMAIWNKITPTGKAATTADIAAAALFFLSPAASQVTGQTLIVDGGWTAYSPPPVK